MPRKNPIKTGGPASTASKPAGTTPKPASATPKPAGATPATAKPYFVSVEAAAYVLGVSSKTVRRAIKDGRLAASRFGRRVLISQAALQQFMTSLMAAGLILPTPTRKP